MKKFLVTLLCIVVFCAVVVAVTLAIGLIFWLLSKTFLAKYLVYIMLGGDRYFNPWIGNVLSVLIAYGVCSSISNKLCNSDTPTKIVAALAIVAFTVFLVLNIITCFRGVNAAHYIVANIISIIISVATLAS